MLAADLKQPMAREKTGVRTRSGYIPPSEQSKISLPNLLVKLGRGRLEDRQLSMLGDDARLFYSGDISVLERPAVSIVGTREVSDEGWLRARKLSRLLVENDVTVVSGLAKGVDTAALQSAMENRGRVAAVIGTPLEKAYPAENAALQQKIFSDHLLISPFANGERVYKSNFPVRNRVMAAISDATVIIEASDTSGTLHQAAECVRLGRWLFIAKSVLDDKNLTWPAKFLGYERTAALETVEDILKRICS
jgi:DNA protecting protein DprA